MFLPMTTNRIINLSDYTLNPHESSLLEKGLNFSIARKVKPMERKLNMEKMYMSIIDHKIAGRVTIESDDNLKTKLRAFGIKHQAQEHDNLTKNERSAIQTLKRNQDLIIQRPDKGGGTVIMNKNDYLRKLTSIIADSNKFSTCSSSQSEDVKKELNELANASKQTNASLYYTIRRIGDYNDGHLYGLPKIHKNSKDPPLRPIISMVGTVTHDIAQYINNIIRPYLNTTHKVNQVPSS